MNTESSNFFLMRHGETNTNRNHIWQGSQDIPLNENGREQAREVARIVREINPEYVITSNLSRAIETGELAAHLVKDARFIIDPDLRERNCGEAEGLTTEEISKRYGISMTMTSRELDNVPGAEPYEDFAGRVISTLEKIYNRYGETKILLVSHGGVIRTFYEETTAKLPNGIVFNNCSILSLVMHNNSWVIRDKYNTHQI